MPRDFGDLGWRELDNTVMEGNNGSEQGREEFQQDESCLPNRNLYGLYISSSHLDYVALLLPVAFDDGVVF